jgi:nucleoside-diphosphate-sugar epimerase
MQARGKIAVARATGRAGRHVVDVLEARGHDIVPMSHADGVDVVPGKGPRGICSNSTPRRSAARPFAGPREESLVDMARLLAARRG